MTKETEARWVERIREWRASGLSAKDFAMAKGYKASTLSWAASLLQRASESSPPTVPVAGEVHPRARAERRRPSSSKTPRFLPVHTLNWDGAFNDNERPKGLLCDRGGFRVSSSADKLCAAYSLLCVTECVRPSRVTLRSIVGPGDDGQPVLTVMRPEET
jgi:hypothetical protein